MHSKGVLVKLRSPWGAGNEPSTLAVYNADPFESNFHGRYIVHYLTKRHDLYSKGIPHSDPSLLSDLLTSMNFGHNFRGGRFAHICVGGENHTLASVRMWKAMELQPR